MWLDSGAFTKIIICKSLLAYGSPLVANNNSYIKFIMSITSPNLCWLLVMTAVSTRDDTCTWNKRWPMGVCVKSRAVPLT